MTHPAPALYAVPSPPPPFEGFDGEPTFENMRRLIAELEEARSTNAGLEITIRSQAGIIGKQRAELEERLENHPRRTEISGIINHWRQATNHLRSKLSSDRVKLVADRLKDGYSPETLMLAIDGLAAFPYRSYGERKATGTERDDKLSTALGSGEQVERFANLGHRARTSP